MSSYRYYFVWWLGLAALLGGAPAQAVPVTEIRVEQIGPFPVSREYVLGHASVREGDELDRAALSRDIKTLQKSGSISYAEALVEGAAGGGVVLTYRVEIRPRIRRLSISGADYLGNKKVRDVMEIGSGDLADDSVLAGRSQKVKEDYRKRYFPDAKVTWSITPVEEDPGLADVQITVQEGKRAIVRRILFTGNQHASRRDLLKVMKQRQSNWLSWITGDGMYNPVDLDMDREALRRVFMDKGYLAAQIGEPVLEYVGTRKVDIHIPVEEGPSYTFASCNVQGVTLFPASNVMHTVSLKPEEAASMAVIDANGAAIRDFYGSQGYIRTLVDPIVQLDTNRHTAAISYKVSEGRKAYIQNVDIRGNTRTKDKVIRRELTVYPGEVYNEVKVRTSEKRIRNLGYFSYVNTYPESTPVDNRFNLVMDVEEQRTGQFMVGAGFSSIDELLGFIELTQGNFDLFGWPRLTGGGQKLKLRTQFGTKRTDYELSFIEPWFLNRRLSFQLDLFRHDAQFLSDEYDQVNTGGSVTLGKPLTSFDRVNLGYGLEDIDIRNVSSNASDIIKQEEGGRLKSSVTLELVHDSRDNVFVPSRGNRGTASGTLAGGPFGGDTDLYLFQSRVAQYWSPWFDHVINLRGWGALVHEYGSSDRVPIFDRLFLGGPRTIRAFEFRHVGPKDETDEPLGGRTALYGTAEYTVPVVEKVRFAVFYDAGIVWQGIFEKDEENPYVGDGVFCSGAGLGIRFDFPGFPIQLDYAWPLEADEENDRSSGRFSFWIGYTY